jgi:deoxyadenosine/deoxycytidine kinase
MHIAIAGNIGSGKTTLTGLLASHYGWQPHYENPDNNPYLDDFYNDMQNWSFNLQIYFLNERFAQIQEIRNSGLTVVQDRTIYEDAYIFAANLHSMGLMSMRDFRTYSSLFDKMTSFVQPPDLLIYLRASVPTLISQIQKRGRPYESSIRIDYLTNLNKRYEEWKRQYMLGEMLIIDVDTVHFEETPDALNTVINNIDEKIITK